MLSGINHIDIEVKDSDIFVIIDGNSLMHRAFYAIPQLTNSKGLHTNVIYGFINMLNKIREDLKPTYIAIAFDKKSPTFRHLAYADYKAGRKKMPEEMVEQIPYLKEVIDDMNIKQLEVDGFEADDIIGTIATHTGNHGMTTLIITGDRDALQLINDKVNVMITKKGITEMERFDYDKLAEVYGLTPLQVIDYKGLMGDPSDNIPGVPGIGEKTALELIKQFGSVEKAIELSAEIKKNKVRENLENNKEQALFSKRLATIVTDMDINFNMADFVLKPANMKALYKHYLEFGFKSLIAKLDMSEVDEVEQVCSEKCQVDSVELFENTEIVKIIEKIEAAGKIAMKIGTDSSGMLQKFYFSVADEQYSFLLNASTEVLVKRIMENDNVKKYGHDIKSDILQLKVMGIETKSIYFDTMIAAYLLNPSSSNYILKDIADALLAVDITTHDIKGNENEEGYKNSVYAIARLSPIMEEKLQQTGMNTLFHEIEMPLVNVLAFMEEKGFKVDMDILRQLQVKFTGQIEKLTESIYEYSGEEFNINSPKQLGVILFEKLNLPVVKKTKTGYSTDVEVLEELFDKHPIIEKMLEYRQLLKLKSTYVDGLMNIVDQDTGRIHSKLNQAVAATGRLSSTEPNLQNIPVKTEAGREIRKAFVAENDDYVLVDADYSQIELRVLAHISQDENLIESFLKEEDIHTRTASEVFDVPLDEVTDIMRKRAKAVNFGIVYGIGDFSLGKDLKISRKEAKKYIENYFARYPKVKEYMDKTIADAKENGYVTTIMNRRRYIPELASKNAINRAFGERMAMNTPIQGSAADIIKAAMVKVFNQLMENNMKSRLILQVHDELIIEAHISEVEQVKILIKENMENAAQLLVPITVDVNTGKNWYEAK